MEELHGGQGSGDWSQGGPFDGAGPRGGGDYCRVFKHPLLPLDGSVLRSAQLTAQLHNLINTYNYGRRMKTPRSRTPYEYIHKCWTKEPERFTSNPHHQTPGPNNTLFPSKAAVHSNRRAFSLVLGLGGGSADRIKLALGINHGQQIGQAKAVTFTR